MERVTEGIDRNFVSPKRAKHFEHPTRKVRIIAIGDAEVTALKGRLSEMKPGESKPQDQQIGEAVSVPGIDNSDIGENEAITLFEAPHSNGRTHAPALAEIQRIPNG